MKKWKWIIIAVLAGLAMAACAAAQEADDGTLTLSLIGDCSMGEMYTGYHVEGCYTDVLEQNGPEWPFMFVRDILEADDLTLANNELVYTTRTAHRDKAINLRAAPQNAEAWLYSGVDAVCTANNHAMDFHLQGYQDSLNALDSFGISHFGTLYPGNPTQEQDRLGIYEVKGVKIGVVAFSYPQQSDLKKIISRVNVLKKDEGCAIAVVCLHWGREEQTTPETWQRTYARELIDNGADVIWGHHPHILQQIMFYQGKPIFFSTGNFTFGSMQKLDPDTGIFQLRYSLAGETPELENLTVIPVRTQGKPDYRPVLLTDAAECEKLFRKLVYRKDVKGMENLPESFLTSGTVDIVQGQLINAVSR